MPLENLPDQAASTLHTLPDGTSEWQVFPAPVFTSDSLRLETDELLIDADTVSIEVVGDLTNRPLRDTTSLDNIPIILRTSGCTLRFNGRYRGEWSSSESYAQNDVVLYLSLIHI